MKKVLVPNIFPKTYLEIRLKNGQVKKMHDMRWTERFPNFSKNVSRSACRPFS